eukprot:Tamp_14566.p4 GENE.Tamp_14566~~Tamp_14566.p4  ORF type:complete len:111 (+),score=31.85 Tamp_14566:2-334(+)
MPWRAGLSTTIKELRFLLNPRVPQSDGCRAVIENHYQFLKGLNPSLRFLVRERSDPNFEPIIQAEFAAGKVEEVSVKGMSEAEVLGVMKKFQAMGMVDKDNWNTKLPDIK